MSIDGAFFIPCYDHNGNIVCYISETGSIAGQYVYDPYGNVIEAVGSNVDIFSFGFSTKYHDRETRMLSYQCRFYRPYEGRWLNRDPIEEEGGENLYAFCLNLPTCTFPPFPSATGARGRPRERGPSAHLPYCTRRGPFQRHAPRAARVLRAPGRVQMGTGPVTSQMEVPMGITPLR